MSTDDEEEERPSRGGGGGGPSEKQLAFIKSLQKRLKLTDQQLDEIAKKVVEVDSLDELGRMEASELIDDLMRRAEEAGVDTAPGGGTATEKQVKFMKSLKRRAKLDDAAFAKLLEEIAGVEKVEDVGKREASALIDKLLALSGGTPKPMGDRGGGGGGGGRPSYPSPGKGKRSSPTMDTGAAPDERPPDRPDEGAHVDDEDLPF